MRGSTIAAYIVAEAWTSLMIMLTPVPAVASPCVPAWSGQFPQGEFNGRVVATAFFDDGQGPALYAAGDFTSASGTAAKHIARWTNQGWVEVGGGLFGGTTVQVNALTVYDDGAGPALYAAGRFTTAGSVLATNIAKWNGTTWSVLTTGLDTFTYALAVYDEDGVGPGRPCLFAGGNFTTAGGTTVNKIARWDGTSWTALTSGTNFAVYALTVYNPGSGERLYAGGAFTTAGGTTVNRVASWDGTTWAALGSGANVGTGATVRALTVYDDDGPDPNAPSLIVGGDFTQAGGIGAAGVAKWNGASWSALGSGISSGSVNALAAYDDDGAGPHLPVLAMGGSFSKAGGVDVKNTARWNGSTWSAMGTLIDNVVSVLGVVDDGVSPPVLYAGGSFSTNLKYMAQWAGTDWAARGNGPGSVTETLTVTDPDGTGPQKPAL